RYLRRRSASENRAGRTPSRQLTPSHWPDGRPRRWANLPPPPRTKLFRRADPSSALRTKPALLRQVIRRPHNYAEKMFLMSVDDRELREIGGGVIGYA